MGKKTNIEKAMLAIMDQILEIREQQDDLIEELGKLKRKFKNYRVENDDLLTDSMSKKAFEKWRADFEERYTSKPGNVQDLSDEDLEKLLALDRGLNRGKHDVLDLMMISFKNLFETNDECQIHMDPDGQGRIIAWKEGNMQVLQEWSSLKQLRELIEQRGVTVPVIQDLP